MASGTGDEAEGDESVSVCVSMKTSSCTCMLVLCLSGVGKIVTATIQECFFGFRCPEVKVCLYSSALLTTVLSCVGGMQEAGSHTESSNTYNVYTCTCIYVGMC